MKCPKCNEDISDGSAYCPKCGEKIVEQQEEGNDKETASENKQENGFKKTILEKWNGLNTLGKVFVVLFGVFGFALIIALLCSKTLSGVISIVQLGGLTVAYLIEKGKIHMKKDWYKYAIIIICVLLSYCYVEAFSNNSNDEESKINTNLFDTDEIIEWSELVIGDKIPELSDHKGRILTNTDTKINLHLSDVTNKEYYNYLEECRKYGYTIDEEKNDYSFEAVSEENLKLSLRFNSHSNELYIVLSPFEKEEPKPENKIDNSAAKEAENVVDNKIETEDNKIENTVKEEVKKEEKKEEPKQEQPKQEQPKQEEKKAEPDNKISVPKSASSFKYEKYQDVVTGFTSLGFTNVKTNVVYDVGDGWFSSSSVGEVKEVSINDNSSFKQGDKFDKNAEVIITYRDYETNAPDTSYTKYTVNKLEQDLDTNPLNAKDTHNNELVEITGKLSNIDSSGKYITLERTDQAFSIRTISCSIKNDEQKEKVKKMTVGKTVTVRGRITSVGEVLGYSMDIYSIP